MNPEPAWKIVERRERARAAEPTKPLEREYPCPKCDYAAFTPMGLAQHQGKHQHWDLDELPPMDECPRCGKVVEFGPNMAQHVRAHERFDNELIPSGQTQKVEATRLRPGDLLVCGSLEPLRVEAVKVLSRTVRLTTHHRDWKVPAKTKFVRHVISRRIDMGRKADRNA